MKGPYNGKGNCFLKLQSSFKSNLLTYLICSQGEACRVGAILEEEVLASFSDPEPRKWPGQYNQPVHEPDFGFNGSLFDYLLSSSLD